MSTVLYMSMSADEFIAGTGAVIPGRRTFELAREWDGDHHDGVTGVRADQVRARRPGVRARPLCHRRRSLRGRGEESAGDRDVMVHGSATAQSMLRAGLLDELAIQMMPFLLGAGRLLFENLPAQLQELELFRSLEGPGVVHLRYRVGTVS